MGRSASRAAAKASSPHAYQSTGLSACWRRYGLVSAARRFIPPKLRAVACPAMQITLDGKVALVTGASRGIGKAIAAACAGSGASVMLSSRKQDALEAAADEIGGDTAVFAANAGEPDQIAACVAATMERFGAVDILVNNAATNPYMGRPIDIDRPAFDKPCQVNFRGPVVWCQEAWKASMAERGGGVLNVASR